ncbi:MAG: ATP-binding protein [bacterium]|nr:ATP-binding protein [bacterium]
MDPARNPYSPGAGARPPALVGRDDELNHFEIAIRRLAAGLYDRSMLLSGLRGVGKTVLLNEFCSIAQRQAWVFQQIEATKELDLSRIMADRIRIALLQLSAGHRLAERARRALGVLKSFRVRWHLPEGGDVELGIEPIAGRADTGILQEDLADLFIEVGEYASEQEVGILITIDEAQYLGRDQLGTLVMGLHKVSQRQLPFMVVPAGLPSLPALAGEARSYAERLFTFVKINSLQPEEAATALTVPAEAHGVRWHTDALDRIVDETAGYPYFLQEFGKHAWNFARGPHHITLEDIKHAIPFAVETLDTGFFSIRFDRTTETERAYLAAMAHLGAGPHASGTVASAMGRTTSQVSPFRNSLISKGLCHAPSHGRIAFTVPMFDQFVRRRVSL